MFVKRLVNKLTQECLNHRLNNTIIKSTVQ